MPPWAATLAVALAVAAAAGAVNVVVRIDVKTTVAVVVAIVGMVVNMKAPVSNCHRGLVWGMEIERELDESIVTWQDYLECSSVLILVCE